MNLRDRILRIASSDIVRAALVLAILLNASLFPYLWGGKTLLSAASDAPSLYLTGAAPTSPPSGPSIPTILDPGAAAWQTEPDFAQIHHQLFVEKHLPLWNPTVGYGEPLAADMLSQPYFPLSIIPVLHPSTWSYNWWCAARLFLAGLGAFCFLRLFTTFWPALAAAISFMYSGYFLLYYNIAHLSVETLVPWVFYANERLVRSPRFSNIALAAGVNVCVYLGGMPESQLLVIAFAYLYAIYRVATARSLRSNALRICGALVIAGLAGVGGSAFLLVPFVEYAGVALDQHRTASTGGVIDGTAGDVNLAQLLTYVVPLIFGPPWGNVTTNLSGFAGARGFFGITALYLALIAVFAAIGDRVRRARAWTAIVPFFAAAAVLLVLKRYGSVVINWIGTLPGFSLILFEKYEEPLLGFAVAVLAGLGVAQIAERRSSGVLRWWAAVLALGVLTGVYAWVRILVTPAMPGRGYTIYSLLFAIVVLAAAVTVSALPTRPVSSRWPAYAVVGVVAVLAFEANLDFLVPLHYFMTAPALAARDPYRGAPFVTYLQAATAQSHERVFSPDGLLFPDWAGAFGLDDVRDLDAMYDTHYIPFGRNFLQMDPVGRNLLDRFVAATQLATPTQLRFLALSSVGYVASLRALETRASLFTQAYAQNIDFVPAERRPQLVARSYTIAGVTREGLLEHPPFVRLPLQIDIPRGAKRLAFAVAMDPAVYAAGTPICGEGADFTLEVRDAGGHITRLFERYIDPKHIISQRHWIDESVNVSRWSGKPVALLLTTAGGPAHNLCADWAVWGGGVFLPKAAAGGQHPPFSLLYRDGDVGVYRFNAALPRVSIFENARVGDTAAALATLADPNFDIERTTVITPQRPGDIDSLAGVRNSPARVRAGTLLAYDSQYVHAHVTAARPSVVVLNDTYFPGWNAYVDGKLVPTLRANSLFRGVVVAPGEHDIEFKYEPESFRIGVLITVATIAAGIAGAFLSRRRRRDMVLRDAA